mgnify:CR=1 FL=1
MSAVQTALVILALIGLGIFLLRQIGGREPVYHVSARAPAFFVALKYRGPQQAAEKPVAGAEIRWSADADFTLIGGGEPYWDRFLIVAGGASDAIPLRLSGEVEDAYVARLALGEPPRLVLGVIRLLVATRIWRMPEGEVSADLGHTGFRSDAMPDPEAIGRLLAQPVTYKPSMVNFLKYYPAARYAGTDACRTPSSGRAAYNRYGIVAMQTVYRTGGHLVFYGRVEAVLREAKGGPTLGAWDDIAVMQYSEPKAILSMERVERYVKALDHRDAALERTVVIASTAREESVRQRAAK